MGHGMCLAWRGRRGGGDATTINKSASRIDGAWPHCLAGVWSCEQAGGLPTPPPPAHPPAACAGRTLAAVQSWRKKRRWPPQNWLMATCMAELGGGMGTWGELRAT